MLCISVLLVLGCFVLSTVCQTLCGCHSRVLGSVASHTDVASCDTTSWRPLSSSVCDPCSGLSPKLLPTRVYHLSTALRQRPPGLSVARLSFLLASRVVPMIRHTDQGFWSLYVFHRITTAAAHQPRQAVTKKRKTTESTSSPWLRGECDVAAPQAKVSLCTQLLFIDRI